MSLENKKLLLLGGSRNMKEVLDQAHKMGVKVGITDWYSTERSPIKLLADEYFDTSIEDYDGLLRIINEHSYDGVFSGYTDSYLTAHAKICQLAELPCYGTLEQFKILTDKSLYKELFFKYDVPTLPVYEHAEITPDFSHYPILLKPSTGSGAKGIKKIDNYQDYSYAMKHKSPDTNYVIEPFIENRKEMTAFFLIIDGEVYLSGTANRFLSPPQGEKLALPVLYSMPSTQDSAFRKYTAPAMIDLCRDLGLQNGILFAQCLVLEGIPLVYDLGYRLTGTLEYKLQNELYGFNPLEMLIRHSLTGNMLASGEKIDFSNINNNTRYGFNVTISGKKGNLSKITGTKEIMSIPQVLDCAFKMLPPSVIKKETVGTLGQIVARIFYVSESIEEACSILNKIYDNIALFNQTGEDMIVYRMPSELLLKEYKK